MASPEVKELPIRVIFSSMLGGVLEFYDFTIYGFLAPQIVPLFFPLYDRTACLILGYGIFSVGFLVRPLGSIVFGHLGDVYGRKIALCFSILLMAFSTFLMGILPVYETVGVYASVAILLIRVLQGLSAGGEYSGGIIFAVEHSPPNSRGFVGSLIAAGCMGGVFLGSLVAFIFTMPSMPTWGWRIPFVIGLLISLIGFYIRKNINETLDFSVLSRKVKIPLINGIRKSPLECFSAFGIAGCSGMTLYVISVYMPSYLKTIPGLLESTPKLFSTLCTCTMMFFIPVFGYLSDFARRNRMMKLGAVVLALYALPFFSLVNTGSDFIILTAGILFAFINTIFMGAMNTYLIELFATHERYSCSAVFYSLGMGLLGGTAPMVASILSLYSPDGRLLAGYLVMACVLGYTAVFVSSKKALCRPA
jgi:MHS family proline/betaine transporter-like MFS transporter